MTVTPTQNPNPNPGWWEAAKAGVCSHGGHGYDGETCSDAERAARGDEIELIATSDPHTRLRLGDRGTVTLVDALGTVHARWASGGTLGLIPGDDSWRVVRRAADPAWCGCGEEPRHTTRVHPKAGDPS